VRIDDRGRASTAVTGLVPAALSYRCRGCQATHILEQLMRLAPIHGGVRLAAGVSPATLVPLAGTRAVTTSPDTRAATAVVEYYLRAHGPAGKADAAGFVGTTRSVVDRMWPAGLAKVRVDGRTAYLPADRVAALENPPEPDPVRLLPPLDPLLQARDRATLVPDRARRNDVWKILGNPGVLLAEGDIAGTWRSKASRRRRPDFTVAAFGPLPPPTRRAAAAEAERIATARGLPDVHLTWS
jgi:hypothetical protein